MATRNLCKIFYISQVKYLPLTLKTKLDRFKSVFADFNGTQEEFGKKIRRTRPMIASYLSGEREVPEQVLLNIEGAFEISAQWIETGIGPKKVSKKGVKDISERYQRILSLISSTKSIELVEDLLTKLNSDERRKIHQIIRSIINRSESD